MKREWQTFKFETVHINKERQIIEQSSLQAQLLAIELSQNVVLEMVKIPAGRFTMGASTNEAEKRINETPAHLVTVQSFLLGRFPITQAQWDAVMPELPQMSAIFYGENLPVVNVWLEKAIEFCAILSKLTGLQFRLPSEAEWEYACRAGTTTPFHFGSIIMPEFVNYNENLQPYKNLRQDESWHCTTPVGYFQKANKFGLYDMHGNVWEWCADIWHADYRGAPSDGTAWVDKGDQSYCIQRGGSWRDHADACRSAFRVGDIAHNSENIVGLRICLPLIN